MMKKVKLLKKIDEVGELVSRDSLLPPPKINAVPLKNNDDWQHCCRYCKYYENEHCLKLEDKITVNNDYDDYGIIINPSIFIEDADNFYCSEWQ